VSRACRLTRPGLSRLRFRRPDRAIRAAVPVPAVLRGPRGVALALIAVLVLVASLTSFAESYRALFLWARHHEVPGGWAAVWPLQVDLFIAVGELSLFVGLVDRWSARSRAAAWTVTVAGLAVSVVGNIGHVGGHSLAVRGTAAVPPLAAASALAVGLGVLKRVVGQHHATAGHNGDEDEQEDTREPVIPEVATTALDAAKVAYVASVRGGNALSARALERQFGIPRNQATKVVHELATASNGHTPETSTTI
jgi:hypothetical protein